MSRPSKEKLFELFGEEAFDKPIGRLSVQQAGRFSALRLDLGGDRAKIGVDGVLTAMSRARAICGELFDTGRPLRVCVQRWVWGNRFSWRSLIRAWQMLQLEIPRERLIWTELLPVEDRMTQAREEYEMHIVFDLPNVLLSPLLWCALTVDHPGLRHEFVGYIYLLDEERGLLVHPYDDRGMDVVSTDRVLIDRLRETYASYVLSDF